MRTTNKFFLRGHLGDTPKAMKKIAKIQVCTNRTRTTKDGKRFEDQDWVEVTILSEKTAAWAVANLKKGDPVYIEARVAKNSYEDKNGVKQYSQDVIATLVDKLNKPSDGEEADHGED